MVVILMHRQTVSQTQRTIQPSCANPPKPIATPTGSKRELEQTVRHRLFFIPERLRKLSFHVSLCSGRHGEPRVLRGKRRQPHLPPGAGFPDRPNGGLDQVHEPLRNGPLQRQ